MGFWLSESNADGSRNAATQRLLSPGPTKPDYGDRFSYTVHETDGAGVQQSTMSKSGERKWIWVGYTPAIPPYESLYWDLFHQQARVRMSEGKNPYVYLKEDVTGHLGKYSASTHKIEPDWVRVLITYVGRDDAQGGSVQFGDTELRFLVDDPTITEMF